MENCEQLLKLGADPNMETKNQRNALHYAVNHSQSGSDASFELENLLISYKADVNQLDSRGRNCLFYAFTKIGKALESGSIDPIESVSSLIAYNADISVVDSFGKNVLHYCA